MSNNNKNVQHVQDSQGKVYMVTQWISYSLLMDYKTSKWMTMKKSDTNHD